MSSTRERLSRLRFRDAWWIAVWTVLTAAMLVPIAVVLIASSGHGWPT